MAERFDWIPIDPGATLGQVIARVNQLARRLGLILKNVRREPDRLLVTGDLEAEGVGLGLILTTPDGTKRYRISVTNAGAVTTTLLP